MSRLPLSLQQALSGGAPRALTFLSLFLSACLYPGFLSDWPGFPWRAPWRQRTKEREWLGAAGVKRQRCFPEFVI